MLISYERGLEELFTRIRKDHPRFQEALVYQQRLIENITHSRQFGDTLERQAERATIIAQLNDLAGAALGEPFSKLAGI